MRTALSACLMLFTFAGPLSAQPDIPSVDYVVLEGTEALAADPATIFYDDFESTQDLSVNYHDSGRTNFGVSDEAAFGGSTHALRQFYSTGQVNGGWVWRFFGDHPSLPGTDKPSYDEIYVRWYHKFPSGFEGFPPKMARMGSFALSNWTLAFMVHYWIAGSGFNVVADVAVNIPRGGDAPGESGYNNFDHWLPVGRSGFSFPGNTGRWISHEMRVSVNDPGENNASYEYWADGRSIIRLSGRSLREGWTETSINAMQLDTYWNSGSPKSQTRYYDNFVISTKPIGPAMVSRTPTFVKTPYSGVGTQGAWQIQIAADPTGDDVVWDSGEQVTSSDSTTVSDSTGTFSGLHTGRLALSSGTTFFTRVRQKQSGGDWSLWSLWHSPFQTLPNAAPQIATRYPGYANIALDPGAQLTFSVEAEDTEGDSLAYSWTIDGTPAAGSADSLVYSVTDALEQIVAVIVTDGESSKSLSWSISTTFVGDLDEDNDVDFADFLRFAQTFGSSGPEGDFDSSGNVDFQDFLIFIANFGLRRI